MEIIINDDNLNINEVHEFIVKVRAILIDDNDQILVANYGNIILLPGGKVDKGETNIIALMRELREELGQRYNDDFEYFMTLNYFQKDYPKRNGDFENRLVQTYYYIGSYKNIDKYSQNLTEKEKKDKFTLELILLEDLEKMILNNNNSNPRNRYFQKELLTVLASYKNNNYKIKNLTMK